MNSLIIPIGCFIMAYDTKNKSQQQIINMVGLHFHCHSNCYDLRQQLTRQKFTDKFLGNNTLNYSHFSPTTTNYKWEIVQRYLYKVVGHWW